VCLYIFKKLMNIHVCMWIIYLHGTIAGVVSNVGGHFMQALSDSAFKARLPNVKAEKPSFLCVLTA